MDTLWLRVRAPFAAFRGFQAGVYRSTSPVMPLSTAYGLILNLVGLEMRGPLDTVTTEIRSGLPPLGISVGTIAPPETSTIYQQLHSYPVGNSGKELSLRTHGSKFWITPIRREVLVGYDGMIGVRTENRELLAQIAEGLAGRLDATRYGLPFAGENNFLIDRIDILESPPPTRWYTKINTDEPPRRGSCRLTVGIHRTDNSRTTIMLAAPLADLQSVPPETAWVWTPSTPN